MKAPQTHHRYTLPFGPVKVIKGPSEEHPYVFCAMEDGSTPSLKSGEFNRLVCHAGGSV